MSRISQQRHSALRPTRKRRAVVKRPLGGDYDLLIIGAGAAGLPAAIKAAEGGAKILLVDAAEDIGGTFQLSSGQMSAAGTRLQARKGIVDMPNLHYDDIMRISRNTAHPEITRLAVDHAAATFDWLEDLGLEVEPDHPLIHYGHEPYSVPRGYWPPEGGKAVLAVLLPLVEQAVAEHDLDIRTRTRLINLVTGKDGRVVGARLEADAGPYTVDADRVLIATGGFAANPEMFKARTNGLPLYSGANPYSTGGGLSAAEAVGASISGGELFLPTFAAVADPTTPGGYIFCTQTYPQYRQPWELYVDLDGRRFVREDTPSVDERERALLAARDMSFWVIYDEHIRREAPSFFLVDDPKTIAHRFATNNAYKTASTLSALAAQMGVAPAALQKTVEDYNAGVLSGAPDEMGREHRPAPIAEAPFYAIQHVGWSLSSFAGLDIDTDFRVLGETGRPIPGLYAVGEVIGFAKTTGGAFNGGMSGTPAMTFGRLFGEAFSRRPGG